MPNSNFRKNIKIFQTYKLIYILKTKHYYYLLGKMRHNLRKREKASSKGNTTSQLTGYHAELDHIDIILQLPVKRI